MKKIIFIISMIGIALTVSSQTIQPSKDINSRLKNYNPGQKDFTPPKKATTPNNSNQSNKYSNAMKLHTFYYAKLDSEVRFIPSTVGPYCPTTLLGGDRDFDGHGPEIRSWIRLDIEGGNKLYATVNFHARETESDWSETEGTWKKLLFTAPEGFTISKIESGKYSEVHYISRPGMGPFTPKGLQQILFPTRGSSGTNVPFQDDGLVTRWNIVGDTMGDDISRDNNPHDDTQVAIQLNPVKLLLHRR